MKSKLILIGAGPGAPDLITLRGYRALQQADVVLYDALTDEAMLEYCRPETVKVYVGKRGGKPSVAQQSILQLIVEYGQQYPNVVRLKGGDSFVFGRAAEEIEMALAHGMAVEVVPGLSSALSVPALSGIPMTERECSTSFWVLTGTTTAGEFSADLQLATQSNATLVILMGMNKLEFICQTLWDAGKSTLPVAIIQNGSLPEEQKVIGTVADIAGKARAAGIGAPAVIVIGEVVNSMEKQPLHNGLTAGRPAHRFAEPYH